MKGLKNFFSEVIKSAILSVNQYGDAFTSDKIIILYIYSYLYEYINMFIDI